MSWVVSQYEKIIQKLESRHFFPSIQATGCCQVELDNVGLSTYDWQRLGVDDIAVHPSQANLMLVAGWINEKRAQEIREVFEQMRKPSSVIAVGACAISGSPYNLGDDEDRTLIKVSDLVPVDVSVTGCPPKPEAILAAVLELKKKLNPGPSAKEVLYSALKG